MGGNPKHKLLVVDDNENHCEVAKRRLEHYCDIEIALGGEDAISRIYNFNPAVVLLNAKIDRGRIGEND